jgi:hypothetical protein
MPFILLSLMPLQAFIASHVVAAMIVAGILAPAEGPAPIQSDVTQAP